TASTGWYVDSVSLLGGGDFTNNAPTITSPATIPGSSSVTENEVTYRLIAGSSASLTVSATDDGTGESALAYTWTTTGPAPSFITPNGDNAAKSATITFESAGDYQIAVAVTDAQGLTTNSTFNARVTQIATDIQVSPSFVSLGVGSAQQFFANTLDQFGANMTNQPSSFAWSASGGGTINSSGTFIANQAGGPFTITAVAETLSGNASVTVNPLNATIILSNLNQTYDGQPSAVTVSTDPPDLSVSVTYDGSNTAPTNVGTYSVVATIIDPNYQGSASGSLTITKANAVVTLGNMEQTYDGTPKSITATTTPAGLPVIITYDGSASAPANAGSYAIAATIDDSNYEGETSGTFIIAKAPAGIELTNLSQTYDGTPKSVTTNTTPAGLNVTITYNGSNSPPTDVGSYAVVATIDDANYEGSASDNLIIAANNTWNAWVTAHFTSEQQSTGLASENADPDADGMANLAEYALGGDPHAFTPMPTVQVDSTWLTLTFTRPPSLPDVIYAAESSSDLLEWSPVDIEVINSGETESVRARIPISTGESAKRMMRLRFTRP
ncbi:MAG: MBG domain-containing protein, partial [Luteolibacter sp.]